MNTKKKISMVLLAAAAVSVLAGLSTVIPQSSVESVCMLGYRAHCSFSPISTIMCFAVAVCLYMIRKKKFVDD